MIIKQDRFFYLQGQTTTYLLEVDANDYLIHHYFGAKLHPRPQNETEYGWWCCQSVGEDGVCLDERMQEYPTYGHTDLRIPALHFEDAILVLRVCSHTITDGKPPLAGLPSSYDDRGTAQTLTVVLEDAAQAVRVTLFYTVFDDSDMLCRSAVITNIGTNVRTLDCACSCALEFPHSNWNLHHFAGTWGNERQVVVQPLTPGITEISNARGASGHQINPFVMLSAPDATEVHGDAYGLMLVYSGNHATKVEVDQRRRTRIVSGINPFEFAWELSPGQSFQTPEVLMGFSENGLGGLSRTYHTFLRENICRGTWKKKPRPILINNWEATYMNFNEEKLLSIATLAADLGIELFVLDDGWFGKRDRDNCSLGDWVVDRNKLPNGIDGLANKITALGMKFGLWFEPEMVNPDSDLYRAHPDWVVRTPERLPAQGRQQLVLDLTRREVRDYIVDSVLSTLKSAPISYVKWDMNRYIADTPYRGFHHAYTLGLYEVFETITKAAPDVLFEGCSSGGGRFDAGVLCYMPQIWTSDNTDSIDRLRIQYGTSMGYPPITMGSHVTDSPNQLTGRVATMDTRGDIAMSGNFGYELDITVLPKEDLDAIRAQVLRYKELRPLVQFGDFYRLISPFSSNIGGWQITSADRSESFVCFTRYLFPANTYYPTVTLRGLDADALYEDLFTHVRYGGDELMKRGLYLHFPNRDFSTLSFHLKKI